MEIWDIIYVLGIALCVRFLFIWVEEKARFLAKGKQEAPQTVIKIEQTLPDDAVIDGGEI